ncbi:protein phosphatase 2C 50-like isoform X1 [Salvia hispanica]|uniref:protein phosphatase 2C 50-like isoform X1 n=1 Tax=Salvia hispanica TaxID=49212 RepID=UPI002009C015|nr:protein phosphatase 2C 50-like isoform X1 [Salvia hispanica]XP_047972530.1 protein phosphatase 2C 50-like isoform X1 [Salvia hispanica]
MEGRRGAVSVPFSLGNFTLDYPKSMEEEAATDAEMKSLGNSVDGDNDDCSFGDSGSDVSFSVALGSGEVRSEGSSSLVATMSEDESLWLARDVVVRDSEEDGSSSLEGDAMPDSSCSLSVVSDASSLCGDDFLAFEANFLEVERELASRILVSRNPSGDDAVLGDSPSVSAEGAADVAVSKALKPDARLEKGPSGRGGRSIFEVDCVPLWGLTSVCGRRPEMEDAVAALPRLLKIPIRLLTGEDGGGTTTCLSHLTGHFFGVYDGHGGSQVANYCRDRLHLALNEELDVMINNLDDDNASCEEKWRRAFTRCFLKVDDEVGGKASLEPLAPETVGSTAIVALVCSSHIIVANSGDSRAVLYRGKEAMALSVDHKPNREDEYARIEASGGKVIQWNGHRVFGVLAMSRSIGTPSHSISFLPSFHSFVSVSFARTSIFPRAGDRYLKPWIIPDPEVMFVPRTKDDDCLVLASDGLWDVMSNDEACDLARKRILLWHKHNGASLPLERGEAIDPAAQAAAEYLSNRATQKGSKDNISVIVVDLKTQRKIKNKT